MKLATFQPSADNPDIKKHESDEYKKLEEKLGFRPIFCISAENYDDLVTQAWLAAPWCPQEIVFFETDDYHTYNIAKAMLFTGREEALIDEEAGTDERCLEYIIKEIPESAVRFNLLETIRYFASSSYTNNPGNSDEFGKSIMRTYGNNLLEYLDNTVKADSYYETHQIIDYYEPNHHTQPMLMIMKQLYLGFGLYFNYQEWKTMLDDSENCAIDIGYVLIPFLIIDAYQNRIASEYNIEQDGGNTERTIDSHIRLYDDLKKSLQVNRLHWKLTCDLKHIGRNDKCFCGSGKKFKKCCGPYLL